MWEVEVKITITSAEDDEWSEEETAATLKIQTAHTDTDAQGEYLPDDEVTHDTVWEAVENWKGVTGIQEDEKTLISYYYEPEKAKKVK